MKPGQRWRWVGVLTTQRPPHAKDIHFTESDRHLNQVQQVKSADLAVPEAFLLLMWIHLTHILSIIGVDVEQHTVSLCPHQSSKARPKPRPSQETRLASPNLWTSDLHTFFAAPSRVGEGSDVIMRAGAWVLPVWDDLQSPQSWVLLSKNTQRES